MTETVHDADAAFIDFCDRIRPFKQRCEEIHEELDAAMGAYMAAIDDPQGKSDALTHFDAGLVRLREVYREANWRWEDWAGRPRLFSPMCHNPAAEQWLALRKEAGKLIDPETAEVYWDYRPTEDPYGIYPNLPNEYPQIGREYFARAPGSDIWVLFGDLPEATRKALWSKPLAEKVDDETPF